jgi:exopolyphosphatase/guanosine-5'-triphosphate,3'-diphosphate pyrophosphatase
VHLLVSRVTDEGLETVLDTSVPLGLGGIVDATGLLPAESVERLVEALRDYVAQAAALGAEPPVVVATEPLRRAANAARVLERVARDTGVPIHVLGHEEEGLLTLLGAARGSRPHAAMVVADVGGGSTEVATIADGRPTVTGLALGAARLSAHHVEHDPPEPAELDALREDARLHAGPASGTLGSTDLVVVGGTASNLAKVHDGSRTDGLLTRERLRDIEAMLLATPSAEVSARFGITAARARVLPAGMAIVEAILDRYGVDVARATDEGLREGVVIATSRAGVAWRDALPRLVGDS